MKKLLYLLLIIIPFSCSDSKSTQEEEDKGYYYESYKLIDKFKPDNSNEWSSYGTSYGCIMKGNDTIYKKAFIYFSRKGSELGLGMHYELNYASSYIYGYDLDISKFEFDTTEEDFGEVGICYYYFLDKVKTLLHEHPVSIDGEEYIFIENKIYIDK